MVTAPRSRGRRSVKAFMTRLPTVGRRRRRCRGWSRSLARCSMASADGPVEVEPPPGEEPADGEVGRPPRGPDAGRGVGRLEVDAGALAGQAGVDGLDLEPLAVRGDLDIRGEPGTEGGQALARSCWLGGTSSSDRLQVGDGPVEVATVGARPGWPGRPATWPRLVTTLSRTSLWLARDWATRLQVRRPTSPGRRCGRQWRSGPGRGCR